MIAALSIVIIVLTILIVGGVLYFFDYKKKHNDDISYALNLYSTIHDEHNVDGNLLKQDHAQLVLTQILSYIARQRNIEMVRLLSSQKDTNEYIAIYNRYKAYNDLHTSLSVNYLQNKD